MRTSLSPSLAPTRLSRSITVAVISLVGVSTAPVLAQEEGASSEQETQEIVVTGSRIANSSYNAPNPVSTLTGEELERLGIVNAADALTTQFSQNISNYQPTNTDMGSFFIGATIANLRGLNPAFGSRTLTLIDGRRVVSSSNQANVVDLNIIPSNLLQRMDVVTGGASAAYGSDAMAGVVNMQLDNRMEGVSLDMDYGETSRGDGANRHVALSGGTSVMDGRGHILLGAEWQEQDAIDSCADARSWCGMGRGLMTNHTGTAFSSGDPITPYPEFAGQPHRFRVNNLRASQFSPNGVIAIQDAEVPGGYRFTDDGRDIEWYDFGVRGGGGPGSRAIDGDGPLPGKNRTLMPANERQTFFGRFEYAFSDNFTAYIEGNYAETEGLNVQWPTQLWSCVKMPTPDVVVGDMVLPGSPGNAYLNTLSPAARAQLQAAAEGMPPGGFFPGNAPQQGNAAQTQLGCQSAANLYKVWSPQIVQDTSNETDTLRGVLGFRGTLGNDWSIDGYYQYGRTETGSYQNNAMTTWRYTLATDSIIDERPGSATFGEPVCRATVEGVPSSNWYGEPLNIDPRLAEGCHPLNPFGQTTASPAALGYAFRILVSEGESSLDVLALNTSGPVWEGLGAGAMQAAVGLEYRRDAVDNAGSDAEFYERTDFTYQWSDAFSGETKVVEAYLELDLPLLSDMPFINFLSANVGVRQAEYRNKGGAGTTGESGTQDITNWKFSLIWEPIDWARLRLTRSRDLRAAGYRELYINQIDPPDASTLGNIFSQPVGNRWRPYTDPNFATNTWDQYSSSFIGNADLKPEKSDTLTAGVVFSPGGWAEGMRLSVDYYRIEIEDGLTVQFDQPAELCWEQSGNVSPTFDAEGNMTDPGINGLFDPENSFCKLVSFGDPDPRFPDNPYSNISRIGTTYINNQPFLTEGVDFSWNYAFPMSRLFDNLPSFVSLRVTANRALESSSYDAFGEKTDMVGQIGGNSFFVNPGIQPTPKWSGNLIASYIHGPAVVTLSGRYVGSGKINNTDPYVGPGNSGYQDEEGNFLIGSIDNNDISSYMNWRLNASYNFELFGMEQLQIWGSVDNLLDKDPPFTGSFGVAGTSPMFHDTLGRNYRIGVRTRF